MRKFFRKPRRFSVGLAACLCLGLASANFGHTPVANAQTMEALGTAESASFDVFRPTPTNDFVLDYSIWEHALSDVVIDLGPSTRRRASKPQSSTGSRFIKGHRSQYRLEGARFTFEYITDDYRQGLRDYRKDLQDIATKYDITKFPKDEQLAFWLNLHNVAIVEKIADKYPLFRPERIKVKIGDTKYKLDQAPFIEVMGKQISPHDIRTKIVFKNWKNSNVIYGFFHGEVGSPSLSRYAFTGENVDLLLNWNADEFVNSLRGFNLGGSTRYVSRIYQEAEPYFFPNWEADLQSHLFLHANEIVKEEVSKPYPFKIDRRYDTTVADLSGGQRLGTGPPGVRNPLERMLGEIRRKRAYLRRRGITRDRKGYVIIEDLVPEEDKTK